MNNKIIHTVFILKLSIMKLVNNNYKKSKLLFLFTFLILTFLDTAFAGNKAKTVLITGANRGLGYEFAKQYVKAGFKVYGTARKPESATELKATGAKILKLDVTNEEDINALAKRLKGKKIDILINNAGYFGPVGIGEGKMADISSITRKEMTSCINVNTLGPLFVTQALLPNLKLSDTRKIINISTRSSMLSRKSHSAIGYSVSKAGLNMVTVAMNHYLSKEGFIVISLAPGHNKTDMGSERGNLEPHESISKMIPLIDSLTPKMSGQFWYYTGNKLAW